MAFHDGASTVICGSDHGKVYIFDRRTGKINDTIHIGVKDWVQSIAVSSYFRDGPNHTNSPAECRSGRSSIDLDRMFGGEPGSNKDPGMGEGLNPSCQEGEGKGDVARRALVGPRGSVDALYCRKHLGAFNLMIWGYDI